MLNLALLVLVLFLLLSLTLRSGVTARAENTQ